jgi:hypothetical protein
MDVNDKFLSLPPESSDSSLSPLSTRNQKITKINICTKIDLEQFKGTAII